MISLSVRIHIFLNKLVFLRLVLLSRFLRNADLAKRGSWYQQNIVAKKTTVFNGVYLFLPFEGAL